jgi:hypothetical protein
MKTAVLVVLLLLVAACTSASEGSGRDTPGPGDTASAPDGWFDAACDLPVEYVRRLRRGYFPGRSPEILLVPKEPNFVGGPTYWSHSGPWGYLQRVPLVFYGPGFIRATGPMRLEREVTLADVTPTLADLVRLTWPRNRPGRALKEILVPSDERDGTPRVIVVVVWDGGGTNVLDQWPDAWPHLTTLMREGAALEDAIVGSSPSVTPAVHATLGTGVFANRHGIVDVATRDGQRVRSPFPRATPIYMRVPSFADLHDAATDNRAQVGMMAYQSFHLGMMGRGASTPTADRDISLIARIPEGPTTTDPGTLFTNGTYYSVPEYVNDIGGFERDIRRADLIDGESDLKWMGHIDLRIPDRANKSPAWVLYQTRVVKTLLQRENFGQDDVTDLLFVNYKQIDEVGHNWNMLADEMRVIIEFSDEGLADIVSFLDSSVGKNRWVLVVTADHGQTPDPEQSGSWAIRISSLGNDVAEHFNVDAPDLIQLLRPSGFWLDRGWMEANGISFDDVADFLVDYRLEQNVLAGETLGEQYRSRLNERIFDAAIPGHKLEAVWRCVTSQN